MRRSVSIALALSAALGVAGCESLGSGFSTDLFGGNDEKALQAETDAPEAVAAVPSGSGAEIPDAVDATLGSGGEFLGTTIASLGDPNSAGLWVRTPLVSQPTHGYVHSPTSNRSVRVELIPGGGVAGGGSQVSLAAMRLLDAPLGQLLELAVYQN